MRGRLISEAAGGPSVTLIIAHMMPLVLSAGMTMKSEGTSRMKTDSAARITIRMMLFLMRHAAVKPIMIHRNT